MPESHSALSAVAIKGAIQVASKPERGRTFRIYLPGPTLLPATDV